MSILANSRERGFSLIELLVSLVVVALVLGGALAMFNYTNRLSRNQLHQADLQQSARVAQREILRVVRMAGRGGLAGYAVPGFNANSGPASITPAIEVRNDVQSATPRLVIGNATSPLLAEGSDVLTVRGHFTSPPLFVASTDPTNFQDGVNGGTIRISSHSPAGIPQDMSALVDAIDDERSDAILIVSGLSDLIYGVAELVPGSSDISAYVEDPTVEFEIVVAYRHTGGTYTDQYGLLSAQGVFPDSDIAHPAWLPARDLESVGSVALLEEYRYYVRRPEDPQNPDAKPRLAVGRFYPNTDVAHPSGGWQTDLADNIHDLQVALGFDSSFDGTASTNGFFAFDADNSGSDDIIVDGDVIVSAGTDMDDWLFNDASDTGNLGSLPWTPNAASGASPPSFTVSQPRPRLYYARLTTLTLTARPDPGYQAPILDRIEDHVYPSGANDSDAINGENDRRYRRVVLTTIADLRNL